MDGCFEMMIEVFFLSFFLSWSESVFYKDARTNMACNAIPFTVFSVPRLGY